MRRAILWTAVFLATLAGALPFLPEEVPLFNSMAIREDRLGSKYMLLIIPATVAALFIVDTLLLSRLSLKNVAMRRLIRSFCTFLACVAYISMLRIILMLI